MGQQEIQEVQQREMQSPAHGEEQSHASAYAGGSYCCVEVTNGCWGV